MSFALLCHSTGLGGQGLHERKSSIPRELQDRLLAMCKNLETGRDTSTRNIFSGSVPQRIPLHQWLQWAEASGWSVHSMSSDDSGHSFLLKK